MVDGGVGWWGCGGRDELQQEKDNLWGRIAKPRPRPHLLISSKLQTYHIWVHDERYKITMRVMVPWSMTMHESICSSPELHCIPKIWISARRERKIIVQDCREASGKCLLPSVFPRIKHSSEISDFLRTVWWGEVVSGGVREMPWSTIEYIMSPHPPISYTFQLQQVERQCHHFNSSNAAFSRELANAMPRDGFGAKVSTASVWDVSQNWEEILGSSLVCLRIIAMKWFGRLHSTVWTGLKYSLKWQHMDFI